VGLVGQTISGTVFVGEQQGEQAGVAVAPAGQFDGAGGNDFAVGAPGWNTEEGTVHQVVEAAPDVPGRCPRRLPESCAVADLQTGAQLIIPDGALGAGVSADFTVKGLVDPLLHDPACDPRDATVDGLTLVGVADFDPEPPEQPTFTGAVTIDIPIYENAEAQIVDGEILTLRYCQDSFSGWQSLANATEDGVQDNQYISGRRVMRGTTDQLFLWGAFVADNDEDGGRNCDALVDPCCWDCANDDGDIWDAPGPARDLVLSRAGAEAVLQWAEPEDLGGVAGSPFYDVIRSPSPDAGTFQDPGLADCVATDLPSTSVVDADPPPPPGQAYFYLVRAENGCAADHVSCDPPDPQPAARPCD
jgi:hypothetical protein